MEEKILICKCHSELILLTKFDKEDNELYLSMFNKGQFTRKPSIWQRIKYCYYHLRTGKIYEDQFIFTNDQAKELGKWLIKNSK